MTVRALEDQRESWFAVPSNPTLCRTPIPHGLPNGGLETAFSVASIRIVVLKRPIFHLTFAVGPSARPSWIGLISFFSFELVLPEGPEARSLAPPPGRWSDSAKRLLQSPPSLCRMAVVAWSDSPHQQSNRAEISRLSRPLVRRIPRNRLREVPQTAAAPRRALYCTPPGASSISEKPHWSR